MTSRRPRGPGTTAAKLDRLIEDVQHIRVLVEVMETQNRVTAEATELYRHTLSLRIDDLEQRMNQRFDVLEMVVQKNSADIKENSADIKQNSADIKQNSADIQQNTADIKQNSADIKQNSADIKQNSADIKQNSADIADVRDELAGVKREMQRFSTHEDLEVIDVRVTALEGRAFGER